MLHRYSGLEHYLASKSRDFLIENRIFNAHTVYTLGDAIVVPEEGRLTVAFSSEILLLNAYRQTRFSIPSKMCVDTTHRLIRLHPFIDPPSSVHRSALIRSLIRPHPCIDPLSSVH